MKDKETRNIKLRDIYCGAVTVRCENEVKYTGTEDIKRRRAQKNSKERNNNKQAIVLTECARQDC